MSCQKVSGSSEKSWELSESPVWPVLEEEDVPLGADDTLILARNESQDSGGCFNLRHQSNDQDYRRLSVVMRTAKIASNKNCREEYHWSSRHYPISTSIRIRDSRRRVVDVGEE